MAVSIQSVESPEMSPAVSGEASIGIVAQEVKTALGVALSAKKPIYLAPSTSPSYYPKTGEEPTVLDK